MTCSGKYKMRRKIGKAQPQEKCKQKRSEFVTMILNYREGNHSTDVSCNPVLPTWNRLQNFGSLARHDGRYCVLSSNYCELIVFILLSLSRCLLYHFSVYFNAKFFPCFLALLSPDQFCFFFQGPCGQFCFLQVPGTMRHDHL